MKKITLQHANTMKGLELKHADSIVSGLTEKGVTCIIISMSKEHIDVEMSGIENDHYFINQ